MYWVVYIKFCIIWENVSLQHCSCIYVQCVTKVIIVIYMEMPGPFYALYISLRLAGICKYCLTCPLVFFFQIFSKQCSTRFGIAAWSNIGLYFIKRCKFTLLSIILCLSIKRLIHDTCWSMDDAVKVIKWKM